MAKKFETRDKDFESDVPKRGTTTKGNSRNKGGKRRKMDAKTRRMEGQPKYNDVSWYVPSDRLLRDSSSLSYNNPLGNTLRVTELSDFSMGGTYSGTSNLDTAIPGVMAIHSAPGVGFSNSNYSPISLAAKSLYARMRKDNSGAKNYDPADLIKYVIALDSAICYFGFCSRIYGCLRLYSAYNRYWPKTVVFANNVDFDDVLAHIADFRYYLNAYALKLNSLYMPTNMNIVPRHFFMYSGLWKDSDVEKSQLYIHVPDWVYKFDDSVTPNRLIPYYLADKVQQTTPLTFNDLITIADDLANALLVNEDIGIISGDLMKAFGSESGFKLSEIPTDFECIPVYNEMVLAQIQATKFMGRIDDLTSVQITESTASDDTLGCILCTPHSTFAYAYPNIAHPINFMWDEVTPEHTMEASRLMAFGTRVVTLDSGTYKVDNTYDVLGAEYPLYFEVLYKNAAGSSTYLLLSTGTEFVNYNAFVTAVDATTLLGAVSSFDHCPLVTRAAWDNTTGTSSFSAPFAAFDYANYTIANRTMLRKMHETAFLSLFGIDLISK